MTRSQVANRLLLSLIPLGLLGFFAFVMYVIAVSFTGDGQGAAAEVDSGWEVFWVFACLLLWPAWWIALGAGAVLKILASRKEGRIRRDGIRFAQLHNWQPISDTTWKSYRRNNLVMTVDRMYGKDSYMLLVDQDGESVSTDGFETSTYALQFGDFLWENVLKVRTRIDANEVRETRGQWESNRALSPGRR